MKLKKILLLATVFLFIIGLMVVIPKDVLAVIPEEMSEEFKSILNEEGKYVVTDNTQADKETLLQDSILKYTEPNYYFTIYYINEDFSKCRIDRIDSINGSLKESYEVEIVYNEQYSDDFKSILKDGKIKIPSSSKIGRENRISEYLGKLSNSNAKYTFRLGSYSTPEEGDKVLVNEDCTKATIKMLDKMGEREIEQHIVDVTYITEKSTEFKKYLNKDGKLEIKSTKFNNEEDFYSYFYVTMYEDGKEMDCSNIAKDFSSCDLTINGETHTVDIVYNYDKNTEVKMKNFVKNFPKDIEYFKVEDMELINYWVNNVQNEDNDTFPNYSGELKSYLNNYNIELEVQTGAGSDAPFATERIGMAIFKFNDVAYYVENNLGTRGEHIIYVPNETGNTKKELIEAAQKRVDEYLGKKGIVTISDGGTLYDAWLKVEYENSKWAWEQENPNMTFEEWKGYGNVYIPSYENFADMIEIENAKESDDSFIANVKVGNKEKSFNIIIKKDSSKMVKPSYKTADMDTNVQISTTSSSIPLDTCIKAEKITKGKEYENIINVLSKNQKVLNVKENITFDLKLYSNSTNEYIKKVDDGEFEVRIPIPDEFKGKTLAAYYVDENNKVEIYDVKDIKDNYAIFTTPHFSIYTIAEKQDTDTSTSVPPVSEGEKGEKDTSPDTGTVDIIEYVSIITIISALGIIVLKRKK